MKTKIPTMKTIPANPSVAAANCGSVITIDSSHVGTSAYDHYIKVKFTPVPNATDYCIFARVKGSTGDLHQAGIYYASDPNEILIYSAFFSILPSTVYEAVLKAYSPTAILCEQPFEFTSAS